MVQTPRLKHDFSTLTNLHDDQATLMASNQAHTWFESQVYRALRLSRPASVDNKLCLPSCFAVSALAAVSMGAVGAAVADWNQQTGLSRHAPSVNVDQRLASLWFAQSLYPDGWTLPPVWDALAGDYPTRDGWVRVHTNLPHHREALLKVFANVTDRASLATQMATWQADAIEAAVVDAGGAAAMMRSPEQWRTHPQGKAVANAPLIDWQRIGDSGGFACTGERAQPLRGLRVLDMTRVLAGPVATRTLAALGAQVLRIDPPRWEEPNVVPEISVGKRRAHLNLHFPADRKQFETLLSEADLLVHGYRRDVLDNLGYSSDERAQINPQLSEVTLTAYGWTGPWAGRRGFDSLVQMSTGIAYQGMAWKRAAQPTPLPVQALDHATGYFMAAAAVQALSMKYQLQGVFRARLSLAKTAEILMQTYQPDVTADEVLPLHVTQDDMHIESTYWGQAQRLNPAITVQGSALQWAIPAGVLGSDPARWDG